MSGPDLKRAALSLAATQQHLEVCKLILDSDDVSMEDVRENQEWLKEAVGLHEKATMASRASEKALSHAASLYSDDDNEDEEEINDDEAGESDDEVRRSF